MKILKVFSYLYKVVVSKFNPTYFAQKIGVNNEGSLYIYGSSLHMFGTEPWLIKLGHNVHITDGVKFITHDGGTLILRNRNPKLEITKPITVGNNVYIGLNSIILPGVTIGDNCIIAAGSIVSKSLESNYVYAGVPAKKIKTIDEYFEKISSESLEIGHLDSKTKANELKRLFKEGNHSEI